MSSIVSTITGQRGGSSSGAGYNYTPDSANIVNASTQGQADQTFGQSQQGLAQQQQFLQALQAQNGLGNQTSTFNQLQGVANGTGPNPAQAALAQNTQTNVANQAALMAGQRGSGQNAGLLARQAAMQGANTQQQSVGQAATLQANQSLNALNSMGTLATNQANAQANATNAYTQSAQGANANVLNGIQSQNNANVGMVSNQNNATSGISGIAAQSQNSLVGNITGGIGAGLAMFADGGAVGTAMPAATPLEPVAPTGPQSAIGRFFADQGVPMDSSSGGAKTGVQTLGEGANKMGQGMGQGMGKGMKSLFGGMGGGAGGATAMAGGPMDAVMSAAGPAMMVAAHGGKVPALVSPGERYLPPQEAKQVAQGQKSPLRAGKAIPGNPKVDGAVNSYANDTVPAQLDPGGIVIPRSITQGKNPDKKAAEFVRQIMAKEALKKGSK